MSSPLSTMRVLLVDDNQHMRSIVSTVLAGVGVMQVRECWDGAEALDALRQWPADVAIVDFQMSPIDGVEFTRLVRNAADSPNPFLPIIMLTGHAERTRVMEARDAARDPRSWAPACAAGKVRNSPWFARTPAA